LHVKRLLIAAALVLAPSAVFAADFSGAWTIHGDIGGSIQWTSACTLKQDASGALTGTCKGTTNEDAPATGSVTGTKVTIVYDTTYQGSPVHLSYAGDVQPDGTVKGAVDTGGPAGTFTLTK
jgi:hypothetical protein